MLDANVRDGLVYYRALKSERGRLDRYVASLNVPAATYGGWSKDQQIAFWLNAYNAFVLETVIDNYPIRGAVRRVPASSIKQVPGAFDQTKHRAAGRSVTLDEIEKTILPEFKDARLYLALGRGAVGSGRLRSEAYTGAAPQAAARRRAIGVRLRSADDRDRPARQRRVGHADHELARSRVHRRTTIRAPPARSRSARRSSGRSSRSCCRTCCGSRRRCCRRTSSRWSSGRSTGA